MSPTDGKISHAFKANFVIFHSDQSPVLKYRKKCALTDSDRGHLRRTWSNSGKDSAGCGVMDKLKSVTVGFLPSFLQEFVYIVVLEHLFLIILLHGPSGFWDKGTLLQIILIKCFAHMGKLWSSTTGWGFRAE